MRHGIAAEPGSGNRQLQEKAGGIDPDGLFSLRTVTHHRSRTDSTHHTDSGQLASRLRSRCRVMIASAPASVDARQVRHHRQQLVQRLPAAAGQRQPATAAVRSVWAHMSAYTPAL